MNEAKHKKPMNEGIRNAERENVTVTVLVIRHVGELFWEKERERES